MPGRPSWGFNVTGVGGGPILQAQPSPLAFGEVAVGAPQDRNLVLSNVGSSGTTPASQLNITADHHRVGGLAVQHRLQL